MSKNKIIKERSRAEQKATTGKIKVLDCDMRINEEEYSDYMEGSTLEEDIEPGHDTDYTSFEGMAMMGGKNFLSNPFGISTDKEIDDDLGGIYESYEFCEEDLGEDNENKTYLDKMNDEAHQKPYENWITLSDDEDPDDILLTESDINSSDHKGKLYRFVGEPTFINQYLCAKLDGCGVKYNPVYEDYEDGKLLEVDVHIDDLKGTGLTIKDLDDWLDDRSLGDWEEYKGVKQINEVEFGDTDFRGETETALDGPLTDTYKFLDEMKKIDEEMGYDFDFLDDSSLIKNPLLLDESINQPDYKFYVVALAQNKIVSGWEYRQDAKDYIVNSEDNLGVLKILTAPTLKRAGLDPNNDKSWGTEKLNETTTTASIAVPDIPAFSNTDLKTKMVDPVKQTAQTKLIENSKNQDYNNPDFWKGKILTLDQKTWIDDQEDLSQKELRKLNKLLSSGTKAKVLDVYDEGGYVNNDPGQPIEGFKWTLQLLDAPEIDLDITGNGIGFDTYPREIEQLLGYNRDYFFNKIHVYTKNKKIKESIMKMTKEQLIKETLTRLHKEVLKEETFEPSKAPNLANSLNTAYKKSDKENSESKMDPYKNASNIVKGSKTQIKKRHSILEGEYRIKNYNIKDKGVDKYSVLVENVNHQQEVVSFAKKDFAKFIFENCSTKQYIKEGKFDYHSYISSKPYSFINTLLESYFSSKFQEK